MAKCIVKQRMEDGKEKVVAIINDGPMTAEVLRLGFSNMVNGKSLFGVEAIPEITGDTKFFEGIVAFHKT